MFFRCFLLLQVWSDLGSIGGRAGGRERGERRRTEEERGERRVEEGGGGGERGQCVTQAKEEEAKKETKTEAFCRPGSPCFLIFFKERKIIFMVSQNTFHGIS
jgi:hypothetical protein